MLSNLMEWTKDWARGLADRDHGRLFALVRAFGPFSLAKEAHVGRDSARGSVPLFRWSDPASRHGRSDRTALCGDMRDRIAVREVDEMTVRGHPAAGACSGAIAMSGDEAHRRSVRES
jgi:hypothetical protein